jgi:hypothetical protein
MRVLHDDECRRWAVKFLRIQRHDWTDKWLKQLDGRTQFETGLTGTPYATDRNFIILICNPKTAKMGVAASQSNPTCQSDPMNWTLYR